MRTLRRLWRALPLLLLFAPRSLRAEAPPLLPLGPAAALAEEMSGELAKRNLELISRQHRMRGSRGYAEAARFVAEELRRYGLADAEVVAIPADGETFYGTQRSRRPWDADFAELWELRREETMGGSRWVRSRRLASWDAVPLSLAQDSESGDVDGRSHRRRRRHCRRGLRRARRARQDRARVGAARGGRAARRRALRRRRHRQLRAEPAHGVVGRRRDARPLGPRRQLHAKPTFAFMVSLKSARDFQARLKRGETMRLHAVVKAGQHTGTYQVVTATIPGGDPARRGEEVTFSCHLDHPRPGANDNASGCAAILEVVRTLSKLITEGRLPRPRADAALRLAARDRGHAGAAQRTARDRLASARRHPPRHGRRRAGDEGDLPRHARAGEPAVVRARRGGGARRLGQPRDRRLRGERPRAVAARRARGRQGAARRRPRPTTPAAATTRSGTTARSASRRSTSTTGPTATSTRTSTSPPTSIRRS